MYLISPLRKGHTDEISSLECLPAQKFSITDMTRTLEDPKWQHTEKCIWATQNEALY